MRGIYKKLTFEDKFARKYYCNSYRFLPDMKRRNRRKLRRILKEVDMTELCNTCLGCQAQEQENFKGVYRCPNWVNGREPEPEQMKMEDR